MGRRRGNYALLNNRGANALGRNPELAPSLTAVKKAGAKLANTTEAKGGKIRLTVCAQTGPGDRGSLEISPGEVVTRRQIKKILRRAGIAPYHADF